MRLGFSVCVAVAMAIAPAGGVTASAPSPTTATAPAPSPTQQPADPFVRVVGSRLMLGGRPFHFVGANLAIMHGPEARAGAEDVLAGAAADGLTVGRIWALGEGERDAVPWLRDNFLFRAGPDGWIDAATDHLDRVVAAAGRLGIRLIITLANNWADYGGVPRYLRWGGRVPDGVYGVGDRFYSDPRARAAYRAHVERLLTRTNGVTGVRYRDDPTILAWELMNESVAATAAGVTARRAWIVEMARLIHAAAPNHLVSPGVGGYRVERERQDWLAVCRLPEVDFCDGHLYPEELLLNRDGDAVDALLDDYVRLARTLAGKPFVLGEFGLRGDGAGSWRGQSRASWVGRLLTRLRFDGAAGGLIWIYQPRRGPDRAHGISVGPPGADPGADALRATLRQTAASWAGAPDGPAEDELNPAVTAPGDDAGLLPLHAEFIGPTPSIPLMSVTRLDHRALTLSWDPRAFQRADWETSGVYGGGEVEHAWGGETGWFEYTYEIVPASTGAINPRPPDTLTVRARVSSEYPGTLSPPDGASVFEVSLDGAPLGRAVAPRDDGRGARVTMRVSARRVPAGALSPGRHHLRFSVPAGPRAHGLAIYGRPGQKARGGAGDDTTPVELRFDWKAPATGGRSVSSASRPPD